MGWTDIILDVCTLYTDWQTDGQTDMISDINIVKIRQMCINFRVIIYR